MRMYPITEEGRKTKARKKAERYRRGMIRKAMKMLARRGLCGVSIIYNNYGRDANCCSITEDDGFFTNDIMPFDAKKVIDNKIRIYNSDTMRYYDNLEEYLKEQLIIKLSGLGE